MWREIAFYWVFIGLLSLEKPVHHSACYDKVSSMHKEEETPNEVEEVDDKCSYDRKGEPVMLKREFIFLRNGLSYTIEGKSQKNPKIEESNHEDNKDKRHDE